MCEAPVRRSGWSSRALWWTGCLRFTHVLVRSDAVTSGPRIRSADHPVDRSQLVIGPDGVSVTEGQTTATVRYSDCVALLKWSDGARHLIRRDALGVRVEPTVWRMKGQLIGQIDAGVGGDRLVTMPCRAGDQVPRPWTRKRTRVLARFLIDPTVALLTGDVLVLAVLITLAKLVHGAVGYGAVILVPAMAVGVNAARTARVRLLMRQSKRGTRIG